MGEKRKNPRSPPPPRGHKSRKIVTKSDHLHTSKQQRSSNTDLPPDVWWDIFVLLPAKTLLRSRAVCKAWRSVIDDDPLFARAHFNKQRRSSSNSTIRFCNQTGPPIYSVDLDALSELSNGRHTIPATLAANLSPHPADFPVDTCHGLVFVGWEILNPLFGREHRLELPRFTLNPDSNVVRGLGYDYATDDYKAVIIDCGTRRIGKPGFPTYVYSLRSDSWTRIGDCPYGDDYWQRLEGPGVYVRGALHWMSWRYEIIALDLETETFRKLQLPPFLESNKEVVIRVRHLDVLNGRLVVTEYCKDDYLVEILVVWVLKRGSWVLLFYLADDAPNLRPVAYMKDRRHILMQDYKKFYLVDAKRKTMKRVTIRGLTGENRKFISAQLFRESLFRPTRLCGVGGQQRMQRRITRESKKSKTRMMEKSKTELFVKVRDWSSFVYFGNR